MAQRIVIPGRGRARPGEQVEFVNNSSHDKTVIFPSGAPPNIPSNFTVPAGGSVNFMVATSANPDTYPYTASNGGTGNGGIEILR